MANSEERPQSTLATLEQCRSALIASGDHQTAHVLSVAILQHRMTRYGVSDTELKELCDAMIADREAAEAARNPGPTRYRRRRPPMLRLVT